MEVIFLERTRNSKEIPVSYWHTSCSFRKQKWNIPSSYLCSGHFKKRIYLLSTYPRLEILEVDGEGKIRATYWKGFDDIYKAEDFIVRKIGNKKRFYLLQSYPDFDVDVFEAKKEP